MAKDIQDPLFAQVEVKGTIFVPEADYGDEFTIVMRGKVTRSRGRVVKGELIEVYGVDAERVQQLHLDPGTVLDAANEQLMAEVTAFLSAEDLEGVADSDTVVEAPPQVEGQTAGFDDLPRGSFDPETGEVISPEETDDDPDTTESDDD